MYYFDPQDTEVAAGTGVIVETARGLEYLMQIHKSATLSNDRHREFRLFPDIRKHRLIFR